MTSVETKENENRKKEWKTKQNQTNKNKTQQATKWTKQKQKFRNKQENEREAGATPVFRFFDVWFSRILSGCNPMKFPVYSFKWMAKLFDKKYLLSTITFRIAPAFVSAILNKLIEHMVWPVRRMLIVCNQIANFNKCSLKLTLTTGCSYIGLTSVDLQTFLGLLKDYFVALFYIKGLNKSLSVDSNIWLFHIFILTCRLYRTSFPFPLHIFYLFSIFPCPSHQIPAPVPQIPFSQC